MIDLVRTTQVARRMADIVDYLAEFSHAEQWDAGTISCERIDPGPLAVGARWRNISEFRGNETEIEYTLTCYEPQRLTFTGENKTVSTLDDLTFDGDGSHTQVRYHAQFDFHGLATLGQPFIKGDLEKLGDRTITTMKQILEDVLSST